MGASWNRNRLWSGCWQWCLSDARNNCEGFSGMNLMNLMNMIFVLDAKICAVATNWVKWWKQRILSFLGIYCVKYMKVSAIEQKHGASVQSPSHFDLNVKNQVHHVHQLHYALMLFLLHCGRISWQNQRWWLKVAVSGFWQVWDIEVKRCKNADISAKISIFIG